jgi:hypothetical protein
MAKKVNKMQAVRDVISKHGKDTMPTEIVKFVKDEHGVTMNADMASTYKSSALKQLGMGGARKGKPGRKPGRKPGQKPASAANGAKTSPKASGGAISLADIKAVKELAAKLGADKVRQLAEVLV